MRCKAQRKDGSQCEAVALESGLCFAHDPASAAQRTAARRRGGLRRSGQLARAILTDAEAGNVDLKTPGDVGGLLAKTIKQVQTGILDHRIGSTIGGLATVFLRCLEVGELEDRLVAIEAELENLKVKP